MAAGHRVFAWAYAHVAARAEAGDGSLERRRAGVGQARGRVVEIGAGTGLNLPHYDLGRVTELLATEPDPHMFRRLARALPSATVPAGLRRASAEALPVADGWADTVVSWLVLCSVPDPATAIAEIGRVLAPDGMLIVCEHVRAEDPGLARWQEWLGPAWRRFGAGCRPDRDSAGSIEAGGFVWDEIERFDVPRRGLARPHIRGVARPAR